MSLIGHASIDENGRSKGGKAGDQTGREVTTGSWYAKNWSYVLRAKDKDIAEKIAKNMEYACDSDYVGYDQSQNTTLASVAIAAWSIPGNHKQSYPCILLYLIIIS